MKKILCLIFAACILISVCACGSQTGTDTDTQEFSSGDEGTNIAMAVECMEYEQLIAAVAEQFPQNVSWQLCDGNGDGANELYVDVEYDSLPSGETGGLRMMADYSNKVLWADSGSGSFGGLRWAQSKSGNEIYRLRYHVTAGAPLTQFSRWTGSGWEVYSELNGFDYEETVCQWDGKTVSFEEFHDLEMENIQAETVFDSPQLFPLTIQGDVEDVEKRIRDYWTSPAYTGLISGDFDDEKGMETLVFVPDGFALWRDRLQMNETSDALPSMENRKTVVFIMKSEEEQVKISKTELDFAPESISTENGSLMIDGTRYVIHDGTLVAERKESGQETQPPVAPSDEELLRIANESVMDQYNFAYYLSSGAVFDQTWENVSDDPTTGWYQVTDSRIHNLDDIETVWYTYFAESSVMPKAMLRAYKEMDGAVYTCNMGVGDNFTEISLTQVVEKNDSYAVLKGDRFVIDPQGNGGRQKNGSVTYKMIRENGVWKCQEISLDGTPWGFQ